MRHFLKLTCSLTLLAIMVLACKQENKDKSTEAATAEQEASATEEVQEVTKSEMTTVLNANLATEEDLKAIGISDEMVEKIVKSRPFLTMTDFNSLFGSEVNTSELYKKMFVPFNLNTTAEADFKMIPGVGDRMAHEFEEYRPYVSLAQFRREIGKYVDETEVARYENYVFVPIELNTASEEMILALPGVGKRMAHEFEEYRPYKNMAQFRKEIGKYVDDKELARLERFVYLKQ